MPKTANQKNAKKTIKVFDTEKFKQYFDQKSKLEELNKTDYCEFLADKIGGITPEAIRNWRFGKNNPSSKNMKKLADIWCISVEDLLKEEEVMERKFNDRERAALKNVHLRVICFLDFYWSSKGFQNEGSYFPAKQLYNELIDILEQEYIDLYQTVYLQLDRLFRTDFYELVIYAQDDETAEPDDEVAETYKHYKKEYLNIINPYL